MSKSLGGWIHSFTVTETITHKDGYTIYKITSIVFPRAVPEALTCITVWKRFHEIKKLYRDLSKRHKSLQLRGHVPEPKDAKNSFFKRFDPEVIQLRKNYILQLLDFAAQHPALYKSHAFLNFFENGHSPQTSPIHRYYQSQSDKQANNDDDHQQHSNIEAICDSLDLTYDDQISLIDPTKDEPKQLITGSVNLIKKESNKKNDNNDKDDEISENKNISNVIPSNRILAPTISFEGDDNDYIYEAAYKFSQAVQAEVNQEYRLAYENYKCGVDKLLTGSKDDSNEERKFIAKAKVAKYMSRADELYEKYLLNTEDNTKTVQLSIDITDSSKEIYLERPWNQLSKFKVIQIIDTVMQVQDVTDKYIYIMKTIEKPSSNSKTRSIFLPQDVPYMVQLLGFFQSDTSIYLLLRHAKGGKLFDHIRTYTPTGHITTSLNEIFTEIITENSNDILDKVQNDNIEQNSLLNNYDSGFIELLNEYKNNDKISIVNTSKNSNDNGENDHQSNSSELEGSEEKDKNDTVLSSQLEQDYIPSFDILSEDMDVNDLVSCSQKLLKSVSNTLEQYKETNIDNNELLENIQIKIYNKDIDNIQINKNETLIDETILKDSKIQSSITSSLHVNKKHSVLPEVSIKQWARELVVAINSLHQKGVILGDLRPDNLLLGSKGQLLLSYFYQSEGTDNYNLPRISLNYWAIDNFYVAPERPLTIKSDWWSFGIILFELLTGYTFKSCHPGNLSCYYEIQYPDDIEISNEAKDLLNQTIQYRAENRLGIDGIKLHRFFNETKWDDLIKRGINSY